MKTVQDVEAELVRMKQAMESAQRTLDSLRQEEEEAKKSHRLLVFENSSMESVKDVLRRARIVHYIVVATTDPMTIDAVGNVVLDAAVEADNVKPKSRPPYRKWSAQDAAFLRQHYVDMTAKELGVRLGVSRIAVRAQLVKLGLLKDARPWTVEDCEFVRLHPEMSLSELMQHLKRSMKSVLAMKVASGTAARWEA